MDTGFDNSALTYDQTFTESNIGKYLRKHVHEYLDNSLPANKKLKILELNCGTGEDAIYLAKKGHSVLASDLSPQMLETAKRKADRISPGLDVTFDQIDINRLGLVRFKQNFDLVFSNFGGLNCISPHGLEDLCINIKNILSNEGRFIAVVMSKYCLWEICYFILKGKAGKSFRRAGEGVLNVNVNGAIVKTFYYSPSELQKIFIQDFTTIKKTPVGFFLPPTYMENYFKKREKILSFLNKLESLSGRFAWPAILGDHFLIEMKAKQ